MSTRALYQCVHSGMTRERITTKNSMRYKREIGFLTRWVNDTALRLLLQLEEAFWSKPLNFEHKATVHHAVRASKTPVDIDVTVMEIAHTL